MTVVAALPGRAHLCEYSAEESKTRLASAFVFYYELPSCIWLILIKLSFPFP